MFRRRALTAIAAGVAVAVTLAACGGSSSSTPSAAGGSSTLTLGVLGAPQTYAAQDFFWGNDSVYGQAVFDGLVKADPDDKIQPSLATEWSYNDDKTVLSMTLRSDVTFTDGTKFNADAAAQNLIRFRDGASAFKSNLASMTDAKALDDTHLQITLSAPDPALLDYLAQPAGLVESPAAFANSDLKTNPVGSGPYILNTTKTVVGTTYVFDKNPNYWDKASQHYDQLVLKVLVDQTAMLNAIRGGQLNGAKLLSNDNVEPIKGAGFTLVLQEVDWMGMVLFDRAGTLNPALKDVRVRQALNYAFDSKSLLEAVGKGYGSLTTQIFPENSAAYDPALDARYTYDPAKAKSLLTEAGYLDGFTIDMPSLGVYQTTFTIIAQQLKDVGITVNFTDDSTTFIPDLVAGKYAATWLQLPTYKDWQQITYTLTPDATFNVFKYSDPEAEQLIAKVRGAASDANSAAALKELNHYIVEQAWFAPWFRVGNNFAVDQKTTTVNQPGNAFPYLWNFKPAS